MAVIHVLYQSEVPTNVQCTICYKLTLLEEGNRFITIIIIEKVSIEC